MITYIIYYYVFMNLSRNEIHRPLFLTIGSYKWEYILTFYYDCMISLPSFRDFGNVHDTINVSVSYYYLDGCCELQLFEGKNCHCYVHVNGINIKKKEILKEKSKN